MAMEAAATDARALPRRSLGGLIAISIFWFALNFHWTALLFVIIPSQVVALLFREATGGSLLAQAQWAQDHKALTLAVVLAPGLVVALLANPLFGLLSDRTYGRFGRRRPYVLAGTALNVVGLFVMAIAPVSLGAGRSGNPLALSILILMAGLMITQLANNAAAAPFHALLPDLVPAEQRGVASGIMGLAQLLGTIGGFVTPGLLGLDSKALLDGGQNFGHYQARIVAAYASIAGIIVVMAILTAITVRERPLVDVPGSVQTDSGAWRGLLLTLVAIIVVVGGILALLQARIGFGLDTRSLSALQLAAILIAGIGAARAFDFRPGRSPDFTWVIVTRMVMMMGINIVSTFMQFYLGDVAHAPDAEAAIGVFGAILTVAAAASTAFAGWGSDRFGRKRMVYFSGGLMAAVGAAFILAPYLAPGHVLPLAYAAGAIYGLGYGAYISVDWALVADVLPSEKTFARDMGVWNIGVTIPQVLAAVFGGWLLALGVALGSQTFGYTLLFVAFAIFCVLGTVTVRYIKGVK